MADLINQISIATWYLGTDMYAHDILSSIVLNHFSL